MGEHFEGDRAVLLVDDAPELRITLRWMLGAASFAIVDEADDGAGAIALALERDYDVAVVDFSLPDMDGPEVARRLAQLRPGCRIAAFTASSDTAVEAAFEAAGVRAFFEKTQLGELVDWAERAAARR
jgi:DNA-binding NarL/FixJ family response regulator